MLQEFCYPIRAIKSPVDMGRFLPPCELQLNYNFNSFKVSLLLGEDLLDMITLVDGCLHS